jgi:DNA-binding response OmpR family regulator
MVSPVRVLVADDDRETVRTTCDILRAHGHAAAGVLDGEGAVARLRREPFDCALLDLHMPGLDGLAALQAARALAPELPVLLASGCATEEQVSRARALGAWSFLPKPIDMQHLLRFLSLLRREVDLLVVGDDPALGPRLGALLGGTRYRVEAERDRERVLDSMERGYKLAVLLDVEHGDAHGLDILGAIRARYPTKPVLMCARPGHGASDAIREGLRTGACAFLPEPVDRGELVEAMEGIRRRKLSAVLGERYEEPPPRSHAPGAGAAW